MADSLFNANDVAAFVNALAGGGKKKTASANKTYTGYGGITYNTQQAASNSYKRQNIAAAKKAQAKAEAKSQRTADLRVHYVDAIKTFYGDPRMKLTSWQAKLVNTLVARSVDVSGSVGSEQLSQLLTKYDPYFVKSTVGKTAMREALSTVGQIIPNVNLQSGGWGKYAVNVARGKLDTTQQEAFIRNNAQFKAANPYLRQGMFGIGYSIADEAKQYQNYSTQYRNIYASYGMTLTPEQEKQLFGGV